MVFAGLWEEWSSPDGRIVKTCAILTVEANSYLRFIHNRMPVILKPTNVMNWLDLDITDASLKKILIPFESKYTKAWKVTRQVNVPAFNNANCLEKLDEA